MDVSEYKYIVFFAALIIGVPAGIVLAYSSKLWERFFLFLMVFFTASLKGTINFESVKDYRGTARGYEIGIVDLATLVIFFVMVLKPKYKLKFFPPGSVLYFIYLLVSIISIQNSDNTMYSWFEVTKMLKMFFYYMVWYNYFTDLESIQRIIRMLPIPVIYIFLLSAYQQRMGIYQPYGPFTHQNSLCMYMMTMGAIFLAALFELDMSQIKGMFVIGMFGLASMTELLTLSRAGVVCYAGCCSLVVLFSFMQKFKAKKVAILMVMFLIGLGTVMVYANSLYNRYINAPESSYESRQNLAASARNMAADGFFGVGLNNFGLKVNAEYPYSKHYMPPGFKEGLVESLYLMIAAETGWMNMYIFLVCILFFYFMNIGNVIRYTRMKIVYLPIAITGGLAAIYLQSVLEWVLKQSPNFYQLMFFFAIIAAMARIHKQALKRGGREALAELDIRSF
ncbi:MAG: O-antigen ligase family protein [Victivallales bacterium]|nr:O-antigen ligase family protein [Victivallales bacterium]